MVSTLVQPLVPNSPSEQLVTDPSDSSQSESESEKQGKIRMFYNSCVDIYIYLLFLTNMISIVIKQGGLNNILCMYMIILEMICSMKNRQKYF